ncbi:MAG: hypothetical protein HY327_01090, partial [Chloroflexi bacterium]|nr:hypothetical protein [Chloroflexota bacterium]
MSWIREQLIRAAAPLLTAVTGRKKRKRVKKAARKPNRAAFTRAAAKRSARLRAQRGKAKRSTARIPARLPKNNLVKLPVPIPIPREEPIVKPVPPTGRAILISPENGKYVDNLNPSFRWLSVGGATR